MTEKRFKLIGDSNLEFLMQHQLKLPIYDYNNKKRRLSLKDTLDLLNNLNDEKESWKQSYIEEVGDTEEQSKCLLKLSIENDELKKEIQNLQAKLNILEQALKDEKQ